MDAKTRMLEYQVGLIRHSAELNPYEHCTVDKGVLMGILDFVDEKIAEEKAVIRLGDSVQVTYPENDKRIGVVVWESDYPWYQYLLRLPDGEEITVEQDHVEKIH